MPGTIPTITLSYVEMLLIILIVLIIYLIIRERNVESFIEAEALKKKGSFGIVEFMLNVQTSSGKSYNRLYYTLDPNSAKLIQIDYDRFNKLKQALTSEQDYSKPVVVRLLQEKRIPDNIKITDMSQGPIIIENASLSSSQYVNMVQDIIRKHLQKTITATIKENKIPVITYAINIELKGNNYIIDDKQETMSKRNVTIKPIVSNSVLSAADAIKNESGNTQLEFGENKEVEPKKSGLKDIAINMVGGIKETFPASNKIVLGNSKPNGKRKLLAIDISDYLKEAVKNMDDFR